LCAVCTYPHIFVPVLFDDVIWIFPLTTFVAMATNFRTKIEYNLAPVKNNCTLFSPTPLFLGPGYSIVSFKFLACQPLLPWQRILGQNWLQLGPVKDNCVLLAPTPPLYTHLLGYIAWQWDRYLVLQNLFSV